MPRTRLDDAQQFLGVLPTAARSDQGVHVDVDLEGKPVLIDDVHAIGGIAHSVERTCDGVEEFFEGIDARDHEFFEVVEALGPVLGLPELDPVLNTQPVLVLNTQPVLIDSGQDDFHAPPKTVAASAF